MHKSTWHSFITQYMEKANTHGKAPIVKKINGGIKFGANLKTDLLRNSSFHLLHMKNTYIIIRV